MFFLLFRVCSSAHLVDELRLCGVAGHAKMVVHGRHLFFGPIYYPNHELIQVH